ncbi:MAG: hypothetical protein PUF16_07515 [Lachnospiraceae bacterium]|nr:hypothetical protein [Lachnospiraceae bacterium]
MKNRNYKKILAVVIASAAVATTAAGVPAVSKVMSAKADSETATSTSQSTDSSDNKSQNSDNKQPPQMSDGQTPPDKPGEDNSNGGGQKPGGGESTSVTYSSATTFKKSKTTKNKTYSSKKSGQNAVTATGSSTKVTLKKAKITKTGSSSGGDSDNFYGTNSAALAKDGAVLTIKNSTIKTTADGANGTFAYGGNGAQNGAAGDGSTIKISNSKITTTGNNAGGIMTTGGGTTYATNLTVKTSGTSSAAIRSDRGGGTVRVNKGTYTTSGTGSPAIYCTSDTSVKNAKLESKASEGIVIEGKNTVTLKNTKLTANNTKLNGQATTYQAVMLYQSMSGDSAKGTAEFSATGGSITNKNGSVFYVTNTTANIDLNNVKITNKDSDNVLLKVAAGAWGTSGKNGGTVTLTAKKQTLSGNITVDDVSSLTMKLTKKSSFTGTINSGKQEGTVDVTVEKGSTWTLTGDSYVSSLTNKGTINTNGHTLYVNGVAYKG